MNLIKFGFILLLLLALPGCGAIGHAFHSHNHDKYSYHPSTESYATDYEARQDGQYYYNNHDYYRR